MRDEYLLPTIVDKVQIAKRLCVIHKNSACICTQKNLSQIMTKVTVSVLNSELKSSRITN